MEQYKIRTNMALQDNEVLENVIQRRVSLEDEILSLSKLGAEDTFKELDKLNSKYVAKDVVGNKNQVLISDIMKEINERTGGGYTKDSPIFDDLRKLISQNDIKRHGRKNAQIIESGTAEQKKDIEIAMNKAIQRIREEQLNSVVEILSETEEDRGRIRARLEQYRDAKEDENEWTQHLDNTQKNLQEASELLNNFKPNAKPIRDWADIVVEAGQGVSQLSFGISSLKGAFETLNNTDLSIFERITTVLPSLLFGFQSLIEGTKGLTTLIDGLTLTLSGVNVESTNILSALWNFGQANLGLVVGLSILAGAIWVVIKAFKEYAKNTPEAKLAAAKKEAKELGEEASKAAAAVRDLEESFRNYNDIAKKLEDCKNKTEEWGEALLENNKYVLDLINRFPELLDIEGAIFNNNGVLSITEKGQEELTKILIQRANLAQASSNEANLNMRENEQNALLIKRGGIENQLLGDISSQIIKSGYVDSDYIKEVVSKQGYSSLIEEDIIKEQTELANKFLELTINLQELTQKNITLTKIENDSLARNILAQNPKLRQSNYGESIAEYFVGQNLYDNYYKEELNKIQERDNFQIQEEFFNLIKNKYGNEAELIKQDDSGATIRYYDSEGEKQEEDFSQEEIEKTVSSSYTNSTYSQKAEEVINLLENADPTIAAAILAWLTGSANDSSQEVWNEVESLTLDNLVAKEGLESVLKTLVDIGAISSEQNIGAEGVLASAQELEWDYEGYKQKIDEQGLEEAESLKLDLEEFKAYRQLLYETNDILKAQPELLNEVAIAFKQVQRGVKTLSEDWDEWYKILKSGEPEKVNDILPEVKEGLQDILQLSDKEIELLPATFAQDNVEIINDVINGVDGALEELQEKFVEESLVLNMDLPGSEKEVKNTIAELSEIIDASKFDDLEVGTSLDLTGMVEGLNQMLADGKIAADDMIRILESIGYDPVIDYVPAKVKDVQNYQETGYLMTPEGKMEKITSETELDGETTIYLPVINGKSTKKVSPPTAKVKSTPKNKGGGGSSKAEKVDRTKKSDVIERYKEINDSIDDMADALDDANKASDRLYGANRLNMMQQQNDIIQKEIDLIREKRKEAEKYYAEDREALNKVAENAGLTFTYDSKGNISNYTSEMEKIFDQLAAAEAKMDTLKTKEAQDNYEEKYVKPLQDKIEALKDAIAQYDETRELLEDLENDEIDKQYELQDNNYEQLNYKLEIETELVEIDQKEIDYYVKRLDDKFFKSLEKAQLLIGTSNLTETNQLQTLEQTYHNIGDYVQELNEKYAAGDISQEAYVEGLQKAKDEALDNAEALAELDETMANYYQDTVAAASEEIEKFTSVMQDSLSVLESYSSLLEVMGGPKNFERIGKLLKAQSDVNRGMMEVSVARYKASEDDVARLEQQMIAAEGTEAYEKYRNDWLKAKEVSLQAKNDMLAQTQAFVTAEKAILDNALESYLDELDKAMTGGVGVDALAESMERAKSLQEEYLTATNKIYETNKLMRTAQNAIDATSNTVAKQRLKQFVDETKQLQEKNKLSNYELEIQQAKYDLLLAEIALEEAQNAKSMVRLQRDSEGNFGYVYTADDSAIADAQQNFEDAQNNLYNISLRGQQEYTEKRIQAQRELLDTLAAINADATLTEEQRAQKEAEAWEFYYQKLEQYGDLYNIAAELDANARADSWAGGIAKQLASNEQLQESMDNYTEKTKNAFEAWSTALAIATDAVGMDELDEDIKNVTDSSHQLASMLLGEDGLISAIDQEIESIINLNTQYGNLKTTIDDLILSHEAMLKELGKEVKTQATQEEKNNLPEVSETPKEETRVETPPVVEEKKTPELAVGEKITVKTSATHFSSKSGNKSMASFVPGGKYTVYEISGDQVRIGKGGKTTGWIDKSDIVGFNTGGYTGAWGRMGKLAMLHEKELVLNQADTANFLASMDILHNIIKMIDVQATSAQLGGILSSPGFGGSNPVNFEQVVHINANFPNATSSSEIEEALNNLVYNQASQFINRF